MNTGNKDPVNQLPDYFIINSTMILRVIQTYYKPEIKALHTGAMSRYSSVVERWATGWMIGGSSPGKGWEFLTNASTPALEPTHSPIQWVLGALSLGVKRPGREAYHSPPSSAEVKECVELYLHFHNTPLWRGGQLKHRDNFTFNFIFTY
jgi:hypothetical protein